MDILRRFRICALTRGDDCEAAHRNFTLILVFHFNKGEIENFKRLDSISLMSLGETVSDISGNIIDTTIQKSKEIELQKGVLRSKEAGYNKIREEIEEGENHVLRRDDTKRISEIERVFRNGEYGRNSRENQGEYSEPLRGIDGLHKGIS